MHRLPFIDALKALASQLIVWHHLAFYGPMSDGAHTLAPEVVGWFSQHARMAVQVFLVISGFLTVRALAPNGVLQSAAPLQLLLKRYVNIALPYVVSLLIAIACTALARQWMTHSSLPAAPELSQLVAHALLLHSVLDMDSLSAGVWYVAIDFQLFALTLGLLWAGRRWAVAPQERTQPPPSEWAGHVTVGLVLVLGGVSLLGFNRDARWDVWAIYFFGAYSLGALAWWVAPSPVSAPALAPAWLGGRRWVWGGLALVVVVMALSVDFRTRIALAAGVAVLLGWGHGQGFLYRWPRSPVVSYLGRISYAVFLMNFPVSLVVNAAFTRFAPADAHVQSAGVVVAWLACMAVGAAFYHGVEEPLRRWAARAPVLFTR